MLSQVFTFLPSMGAGEWMMIVFLVMLLFGAKKIPELARGLGKGIREFKDAASNVREEIESADRAATKTDVK